jgi:predicted small lipoprotein YifL
MRLSYTASMRALLTLTAVALAACGQTGDLYLPDASVETPVEIRGPNAPAEDDKEKKPPEPPGA